MHLGRDNGSGEDTATDRNHTGEGAFLVYGAYSQHQVQVISRFNAQLIELRKVSSSAGLGALLSIKARILAHTDVSSVNCSLRCSETQSNFLVPSSSSLAHFLGLCALCLRVEEDMRLLLESTLRLHCQFGRHDRDALPNAVSRALRGWKSSMVVAANDFDIDFEVLCLWVKLNRTEIIVM